MIKTVFVLGAGFSRAVVGPKAPLTDELMATLDIAKFPEIHEYYERAFPNIEQFLSLIDLSVLHFRQINNSISHRLNTIRDIIITQIIQRVDIESVNVTNLDDYILLKNFIGIIPAMSYVLSLNYDCIVDQGLYLADRWSPFVGYGFTAFPHTKSGNDLKDNILLLKLHGSCNFRDSVEGQQYPDIEITDRIFPRISARINSNPNNKPHVLVMSYIKQFHNGILYLWKKAISALEEAEKLTIVGCSLREEDTFLKFALYHFGMKKDAEKFFIDIVDKGEDNCNRIKGKALALVAWPDRQQINLFDGGLESYLNKT